MGITHNVSETGMLVESELNLETGNRIDFEFMIGYRPVAGVAEVVRLAHADRDGVNGYGVRFVDFSGDSRKRFQSFLERL